MSDYTPTTEYARDAYQHSVMVSGPEMREALGAEFDRWLAARDREVAARALRVLYGELASWEGYDTRDIGWAFLADSVLEHIDEKRAELEREDEDV